MKLFLLVLGALLIAAPAHAITFNDGGTHIIDADNSYPLDPVVVEDSPTGQPTTLIINEGGDIGSISGDGLTANGKRFFAVIEPKHGTTVAIYLQTKTQFWQRRVLDETLKDGHALAVADYLGTGGDQVVAGWRGMNTPGVPGVRLYVPQDDLYTRPIGSRSPSRPGSLRII